MQNLTRWWQQSFRWRLAADWLQQVWTKRSNICLLVEGELTKAVLLVSSVLIVFTQSVFKDTTVHTDRPFSNKLYDSFWCLTARPIKTIRALNDVVELESLCVTHMSWLSNGKDWTELRMILLEMTSFHSRCFSLKWTKGTFYDTFTFFNDVFFVSFYFTEVFIRSLMCVSLKYKWLVHVTQSSGKTKIPFKIINSNDLSNV